MSATAQAPLSAHELAQFTGTEHYYAHALSRIKYTDGVKFLAERAACYWLIDKIGLSQRKRALIGQFFQVWKLTAEGSRATLVCDDGNGNVLLTEKIPFTDFPLPEIKLWFTDNVLILPSEY